MVKLEAELVVVGSSVEIFVTVGAPVGDVTTVSEFSDGCNDESFTVGAAVGVVDDPNLTVGCNVGFRDGTRLGISTAPTFWHISRTLSQSQSSILVVGHENSTSGGKT